MHRQTPESGPLQNYGCRAEKRRNPVFPLAPSRFPLPLISDRPVVRQLTALLVILALAAPAGARSPEATAKRSKADIERTLKSIEATARASGPASPARSEPSGGKAGKGEVALVVTPSELAKARAELARLNGYRYLAGLNHDVKLKDEWNLTCKYAAHVCAVLGTIDHTPPKPPGMDDATHRRGYEGASNSNLFWTSGSDGLTGSVDGYMDDSDPSNVARVGHRRWCLNPAMRQTGFGVVKGASAMWSMDGAGDNAPGAIVCFPSAGFHPMSYYTQGTAWSVSLDPGRYQVRSPQVKVYGLKSTTSATRFPADVSGLAEAPLRDVRLDQSGIGIRQCLIFRPMVKATRGDRFGVVITGVEGRPENRLAYVVEFF